MEQSPLPGGVAAPSPSKNLDGPALQAAAQTIEAALPQNKRLLPNNRMTRSDTSMSHLLTEGELSRLETASKFGGMAGGAALVYGALVGVTQPFAAAALHLFRTSRADLTDGEMITLAIGLILIGAAVREYFMGATTETVPKICSEYRRRPQSDMD